MAELFGEEAMLVFVVLLSLGAVQFERASLGTSSLCRRRRRQRPPTLPETPE